MGAAKVGKSAIINQFLYNTFTPKYKRTVEEMHHGDFNVSGIQLTLDILDTSGSYEFPAMRDLSIKSADAFILVYDVNDANTFLEVKTLRAQILSTKGAVPIVVVGNKVDLVDSEQEVPLQLLEFPREHCSRGARELYFLSVSSNVSSYAFYYSRNVCHDSRDSRWTQRARGSWSP